MTSRECGGCTACCTVNGIEELDKPIRTTCTYECSKGCAIYTDRPQSCRNFMCVWIRGFGSETERPDRLGLFIEERPGPPDGRQFFVKEVWEGAAHTPQALDYLTRLQKASGQNIYIFNMTLDELVGKVEVKVDKKKLREQRRKRRKRS